MSWVALILKTLTQKLKEEKEKGGNFNMNLKSYFRRSDNATLKRFLRHSKSKRLKREGYSLSSSNLKHLKAEIQRRKGKKPLRSNARITRKTRINPYSSWIEKETRVY